ncbi:MAG: c-type cytochrome [Pseudomonadota bacterium]
MIKKLSATMLCFAFLSGCGGPETDVVHNGENGRVAMKPVPVADPERGRALFVEKGCVICHAVNGVGGKAAPVLDAPVGAPPVDALEFAAKMWRGAPAMIELQSVELGYTIYLTADEIADLAAFAADRDAQKKLVIDDLPETTKAGLLDQRFWEMEDWDDILRAGREGFEPSPDAEEEGILPVDPD